MSKRICHAQEIPEMLMTEYVSRESYSQTTATSTMAHSLDKSAVKARLSATAQYKMGLSLVLS